MPASSWAIPTAQVGANLTTGQLTGVSTTPVALGSQSCCSVVVQNDPSSGVNIAVGTVTAQYLKVTPGNSVTIGCQNISQVYVSTASGTATVNWMSVS